MNKKLKIGDIVENTKKFAVLIDADNSSVNSISSVLEEVAKYGIASVKRVYGDWSSDSLKNGEKSYCRMRLHLYSNLHIPAVKMLQI